jgi:DUF971 family protein
MSLKSKITNISIDNEAQIVSITWGDNTISKFNNYGLRKVCPCVFCRGGHEFMGKKLDVQELLKKPAINRNVTNLKVVGNYALQFTWNDGHNTGLYQIESLRELWEEYVDLLTPKD